MSDWVPGQGLFNPVIDFPPPSGWEILGGPFGLIAFLPLIPLLRVIARAKPRTALLGVALVWLVGTAGPVGAGGLLIAIMVGAGWISLLARLRLSGCLGQRGMVALVWIGLHLLVLPLWWFPNLLPYGWDQGRMPALHALGYAYFVLRLVAWGVRLAREPEAARRPADTLCWLLYPPCMRLGPVLLREQFLQRLDGWDPRGRVPVLQVAQRLGLCLLGLIVLGVVMRQTPSVAGGAADFFAAPQDYSTGKLVRVLYLVPLQIYLMLWSYNELACGLSLWVGIRVDNNFNWLPRAASIKDFWRRWHITVGSWMRDYIYIPLGGNRGFVPLRYFAVFAYCGLWHGASLSFLAWGVSQALGLTIEHVWERAWSRSRRGAPPTGRAWTLFAWLLTLHYQTFTILMFADFNHLGFRLVSELFGRLAS